MHGLGVYGRGTRHTLGAQGIRSKCKRIFHREITELVIATDRRVKREQEPGSGVCRLEQDVCVCARALGLWAPPPIFFFLVVKIEKKEASSHHQIEP